MLPPRRPPGKDLKPAARRADTSGHRHTEVVMGLAILLLALFPVLYVYAPRPAMAALALAVVLIYRKRTR